MSNLDKYISQLKKKHVGETRKQKIKRVGKEVGQIYLEAGKIDYAVGKKGVKLAQKALTKSANKIKQKNTPENRARLKKDAIKFYKLLQKI